MTILWQSKREPGVFYTAVSHEGYSTKGYWVPADSGIGLLAAERGRQISKEGWDGHHDKQHSLGELSAAAAAYALHGTQYQQRATCAYDKNGYPNFFPDWEPENWKPKDRLRNLERAGALIAAEIDRLKGDQ